MAHDRHHPPATREDGHPTIFIACPWTPVGGGMFKVADYLMQSQADAPRVMAGTTASGADGLRGGDGHARLLPLDTRGDGSAAASLLMLAGALRRLARAHRQGRVAGVHVNMAERLSLVRKSVLVLACRAMGIPVVLHLHAAQLHRAWPRFPRPLRWIVRQVFALPAACIVLGRQSADFVVRELRVPRERVEVVINGVPQPLPAGRRTDGPPRLLFVGNLSERKGVPELLQALALPPLAALQAQLTLVGGGDLPHWRALARALGLGQRARFEGWADQPRVGQLLSQSDALVLPSHDEGLPLAILEALAHGVPVVCTPVGEIPHVLTDGRDACFVPPGDAQALARTLARLLGDAGLRERLARQGQALWHEHFTLPRFFERIAAIHARHFGVSAAPAASRHAGAMPATLQEESIG